MFIGYKDIFMNLNYFTETVINKNHIYFSDSFNEKIDNLSTFLASIKYITFGDKFNQPIDKLSNSIKGIKFGRDFNQPVENLPINLKYLEFGENFYQPLDKLPVTLKKLIFFNRVVNSEQLFESAHINSFCYALVPEMNQPSGSVRYYKPFECYALNNLPNNIKKIELNEKYLENIEYLEKNYGTKSIDLPVLLKKIKIPKKYAHMFTKIPFDCKVILI